MFATARETGLEVVSVNPASVQGPGRATGSARLLLDFLNVDTNPPIGLMALWPFSDGYYKSPWSLFLDIGRTLNWTTVRHDTLAMAWEVVVLCPVLVLAWRARARRPSGAWDGARVREQVRG